MSPLLHPVEAAGLAGLQAKRVPTNFSPASFFEGADRVRHLFAQLVQAKDVEPVAQRVALIPAVSYGMATVAQNVTMEAGQSVVVLADQFPSHVYPWRRLADLWDFAAFLDVSMAELERRLHTRAQDSDEVIAGRMKKSRDEISHWDEYDYVLINDNLDRTEERLKTIVMSERMRKSQQPFLMDHIRALNTEFEER